MPPQDELDPWEWAHACHVTIAVKAFVCGAAAGEEASSKLQILNKHEAEGPNAPNEDEAGSLLASSACSASSAGRSVLKSRSEIEIEDDIDPAWPLLPPLSLRETHLDRGFGHAR